MECSPQITKNDRDTISSVVAMFDADNERRCVRMYLQWVVWDRDTDLILKHFRDVPPRTVYHYLQRRGPFLMEKFRARLPDEIKVGTRRRRAPFLLQMTMHALPSICEAVPEKARNPHRFAPKWAGWTPPPSTIRARLGRMVLEITGAPRAVVGGDRRWPGWQDRLAARLRPVDRGGLGLGAVPVLAAHPPDRAIILPGHDLELHGLTVGLDDAHAVAGMVHPDHSACPRQGDVAVGRPSPINIGPVEVDLGGVALGLVCLADGRTAATYGDQGRDQRRQA